MTIKRKNHGQNHSYYDVDEAGEERKIPGVTTLLSDGIPKGGLVSWAAESAASYAVENWNELGQMNMLKRAKEIQFAWKRNRDSAAVKGSKIHAIAEKLVRGEVVDVPDEVAGYVEACVAFLNDYDVAEVLNEAAVINRAVPYAGTLDLVADLKPIGPATESERWIIDWKTGKSVYAEAALQIAAYAHAEHYLDQETQEEKPMQDLGIQRGAVVHLRSDGYDMYEMNIGDQPFALFRHAAWVGEWVRWDRDSASTRMDSFKLGRVS